MSREAAAVEQPIPIAVTVAGSDSGGGAGVQADIKTFSALGVYAASALTALTAQNTRGVAAIHEVPAPFVVAQMDAIYSDLDVSATKIGMLSRAEIIVAVAEGLRRWKARRVVLDPVMVATSGARLMSSDAIEAMARHLFPLIDIVTPNLDEAAALTGETTARNEPDMARQAEKLVRLGARAALVKGGHGSGAESVDLLFDGSGITRFAAPRIDTRNTHGTGCTLSAAIAAELAKGADMSAAIGAAKAYLTAALASIRRLNVGSGAGPVDHFHAHDGR